jgi:hypothetical protein
LTQKTQIKLEYNSAADHIGRYLLYGLDQDDLTYFAFRKGTGTGRKNYLGNFRAALTRKSMRRGLSDLLKG